MKSIVQVVCMILASMFVNGCAMSNVVVERTPLEMESGESRSDPVPIFEEGGTMSRRAIVPFASMGAHGNGYATKSTLKVDLARKAAQLGADCVLITQAQLNNAGAVTSYGGGIAISTPVQTMSLFGVAGMYAPVRLGTYWDKDYKILDVTPGSSAARAGIHIGDRILAIDGMRVTGDPYASWKAILKARPGQTGIVEVVGPDNTQRKCSIVWDPND